MALVVDRPAWVLNIKLNARASVRSFEPQFGQVSPIWSARHRSLQLRQSTIGSVKFARCPEASHTAGGEGSPRRAPRRRRGAGPSRATTPPSRCAGAARRAGRSRRSTGTRRRARRRGRRSRATCTASTTLSKQGVAVRGSIGRDTTGRRTPPPPTSWTLTWFASSRPRTVRTTRLALGDLDEVAERLEVVERVGVHAATRAQRQRRRLERTCRSVQGLAARRRVLAARHRVEVPLRRAHVPRPVAARWLCAEHPTPAYSPWSSTASCGAPRGPASPSWRSPPSDSRPRRGARRRSS